jgi:hypothetical protein
MQPKKFPEYWQRWMGVSLHYELLIFFYYNPLYHAGVNKSTGEIANYESPSPSPPDQVDETGGKAAAATSNQEQWFTGESFFLRRRQTREMVTAFSFSELGSAVVHQRCRLPPPPAQSTADCGPHVRVLEAP